MPGHGQPAGHGRQEVARPHQAPAAQGQGQVRQPGAARPAGARRRDEAGRPRGLGVRARRASRPRTSTPRRSSCPPGSTSSSADADARADLRLPLHLRDRRPGRRARGRRGLGGRRAPDVHAPVRCRRRRSTAWCCPAWSTCTATSASPPTGPVPDDVAEQQALADRDSGVLLVRDAGSPADTGWVHARDDLPRLIRSGRHLALPKRYLRHYGRELGLAVRAARRGPRGGGARRRLGQARRGLDRPLPRCRRGPDARCGRATCSRDAVAAAHDAGARVTAHTFATESLDDLLDAGIDCLEHATGASDDHIDRIAAARHPGHRHAAAGRAVRGDRRAGRAVPALRGAHARHGGASVRARPEPARGRRAGARRHGRGRDDRPRPIADEAAEMVRGRHPCPRTSSPRRAGGRAPGWARRASRRVRARTSSSTPVDPRAADRGARPSDGQ